MFFLYTTILRQSVCLLTPHLRQSFCLFTPLLRQCFCIVIPLLRQSFAFHTPKNCTWETEKWSPPTTTIATRRRTTLSSRWSVGCAADKKPQFRVLGAALIHRILIQGDERGKGGIFWPRRRFSRIIRKFNCFPPNKCAPHPQFNLIHDILYYWNWLFPYWK